MAKGRRRKPQPRRRRPEPQAPPPRGLRRLGGSQTAALAAAIAGYVLLLGAWAMGNPPFASPDETAHFIRAVGVGGGDLIGEPGRLPVPAEAAPAERAVISLGNRFARTVTSARW